MPYSAGGKASGSPVLSDSSTRNTNGRMTRKLTTSTTMIVMIACQLRRGFGVSPKSSVKSGSAAGSDDAVPFLGEGRPIFLELAQVGGHEKLHVLERHTARRRRHVGPRRMQQQRVAERLLAEGRKEPVHEQFRGIGMRAVSYNAVDLRHGRHACVRI